MASRTAFVANILLSCACLASPLAAQARCALAGETPAALAQWKASGFAMADAAGRTRRALALVDCLGEADPSLRDGIAFEALSAWLRGKQLDTGTLWTLEQRLLAQLEGVDAQGFRKPFAALALSEVARTDRVQPWMAPVERARSVAAAATYLRSIDDYRGYVDGEGWRHGVAHGSDWALQLVLNKAIEPVEVMSLLAALGSQVTPSDGHAHSFGEPNRLARPVAYAVARGDLEPKAVDAWLAGLVVALGMRPQGEQQATWWTRRANLENFLNALGYMVAGDQSPALVALAASVRTTLQQLP